MSCSQSCSLFYKKKFVCSSDPCSIVGFNCRKYGAGTDVLDCLEWCCERDTSTLAVFVVVIIIVVLCCAFCCAFGVYRFILRKRSQAIANGVQEVEVEEEVREPPKISHRSKGHNHRHTAPTSARSEYSEVSVMSERGKKTTRTTSSQGKTISGDRMVDYRDEYSESAYEHDQTQHDDEHFLDEPTVSARTSQSAVSRPKQLGVSYDSQSYDQLSARSAQLTGRSATTTVNKKGVWTGDADSQYYDEETPRSATSQSHDTRRQTAKYRSEENDLFTFEDDF